MQLTPSPRGSLGSLAPQKLDPSLGTAGMVMLQVMSVGLNFRDVLNVLGAYPGDPGPPGDDPGDPPGGRGDRVRGRTVSAVWSPGRGKVEKGEKDSRIDV